MIVYTCPEAQRHSYSSVKHLTSWKSGIHYLRDVSCANLHSQPSHLLSGDPWPLRSKRYREFPSTATVKMSLLTATWVMLDGTLHARNEAEKSRRMTFPASLAYTDMHGWWYSTLTVFSKCPVSWEWGTPESSSRLDATRKNTVTV